MTGKNVFKTAIMFAIFMVSALGTKADTFYDTSSMSAQDKNAPIGWGASTTGSDDENQVTVTSLIELTTALAGTDKKTIIVDGTITFTGRVTVENVENKTIYGLPGATLENTTHTETVANTGILTLKNCSNIIIRNLTFKGAGAYDIDGNDNLTLQACSNIWVDHCDFQDGVDGNLDCNNGSDNICVSWCRFRYLIDPWAGGSGGSNDHRFSNLWGGGDSATGDEGKLNTTFYACWWDEGCKQRMPRIRFGKVHILNCLYSSSNADYCIGAGYRSNIYVEKSCFASSGTPWQCYATSSGYTDYNIQLTGNQGAGDDIQSSGSIAQYVPSYAYTAMDVSDVQAAVTASNGAGATLKMPSGIIQWKVTDTPAGGIVTHTNSDLLQIAFGTAVKDDANNWKTDNGTVSVTYKGTTYSFDKYATTNNVNGTNSKSLAANGSTNNNYIAFVPKYDGTLILVGHNMGTANIEKPTWCYEDGVVKSGTIIGNGTLSIAYDGQSDVKTLNGGTAVTGGIQISVTANKLYTFSIQGSKARWCGVIYDYDATPPTPAQTYTTVYDLAESMMALASNFEGNKGSLAATTADAGANAPELAVDATSGKLGKNSADWAQLNEGAVLTLPGVPEGATITFALYNTTALTINGVAYTNGQTYIATKDENVVMTCTTSGYIKSITVEGTAFVTVAAEEEGYTNTWQFGKSNGAEEFALQRSAEYTYTVNDHSLVVNTDAGKLNNATRTDQWCQCNDGTLFKIPVFTGAKLTWGRYNGGSGTGFTIDGQLFNDYYIAAEDGTVNMTAKGISYLSYIKVEPATLYEITGTISGGDINGTDVLLTAAGNGEKYSATVASNAFTMKVPADTYTPELSSEVAFVVSTPSSVTVSGAVSIGTITIEAASAQMVTGAIANAPAEAFTLTFTGANNIETLDCAAGATSFSKELMPDTYTISSSVGTLSPLSAESFTVLTSAISHNIYFPEAAVPAATQQTITVDNTAIVEANVYNTVSDALTAAKAGNISSPIITLTSGQTYREQVVVDMANVTFKTSGTEKATITWYYGIGYAYYSLNANGLYDKDRAMTRNSIKMIDPVRWGATVLVKSTGNGFKAENIIFENSFNQYYTTEEVADGVTPNGVQSITYNRTLAEVASGYKAADAKAVTERAAAIAFENNPSGVQLYNCVFIGSQDTFYSSGKIYVKNCNIIGNTDYIFGGGYVVFDDCDLTIGGYSDQSASAYITAYKDGNTLDASKKYVFRDCTVKKTDRQYVSANLGRDWGGAAASVYFFNLNNEIGDKLSCKWTNMGGGVSAGTADLHIYDFDPTVNSSYSSTGSNGANINGLVSDADATTLYTGVVNSLGFTPEHIYDITLDEDSYYNPIRIKAANGGMGDITLKRTIGADKWSTIVLPFDMTSDQLTETFGNGVQVAELKGGDAATLNFETVTATVANQPYAIKVTSSVETEKTVGGVTIAEDEPTLAVSNWNFVGTYASGTIPIGSFFFSGNMLYSADDATNTIKPFRAYFTSTAGARKVKFIIDGEASAIGTIKADGTMETMAEGTVYNLQGQRVATSILNSQSSTPKKGLYIVNGKKVMVK